MKTLVMNPITFEIPIYKMKILVANFTFNLPHYLPSFETNQRQCMHHMHSMHTLYIGTFISQNVFSCLYSCFWPDLSKVTCSQTITRHHFYHHQNISALYYYLLQSYRYNVKHLPHCSILVIWKQALTRYMVTSTRCLVQN